MKSFLIFLIPLAVSLAHQPLNDAATTANRFLASLDQGQREQCRFSWEDSRRHKWNFLPDKFIRPEKMRFGLRWDKMRSDQQFLAQALLGTALSSRGQTQAAEIIALEQVLHELERQNPIRDPSLYYLTIFGEPTPEGTWAWRFEGHHLSINVTIVAGTHAAITPTFVGANPAHNPASQLAAAAPLAEEEDLARKLVKSLTPAQLKSARFAGEAPRDIFTGSRQSVARDYKDWFGTGIRFADLNPDQQLALRQLAQAYTGRYRPELLEKLADGGFAIDDDTRFAWAGGLDAGDGHYYRIVTKRYLIEYDNVQNGANHAHTTWRDFDGDFGTDLLEQHHRRHHQKP